MTSGESKNNRFFGSPLSGKVAARPAWFLVLAGCAAVALFFSNGRFSQWPAAWLGPLLLVRLVRSLPARRGLALGYVLFVLVVIAQWWGAWGPLSGPVLYGGAALAGFLFYIPYLLDRLWRLLAAGRASTLSTLVLPAAQVSVEYLFSLAIANTGALGYTQVKVLPLLQLVSVTGVFGVSFLLSWFAALANLVWEQGFSSSVARRAMAAYGITLAIVLAFGCWRLASTSDQSPRVAVAAYTLEDAAAARAAGQVREPAFAQDAAKLAQARAALLENTDRLFARAEAAARAGAQIILWSEVAALVFDADEPALLAKAGALARQQGVYLGMALGLLHPGQRLLENQLVVVDPSGKVTLRYTKSFLAPGEPSVVGDHKLRFLRTPLGVLTGAICADLSDHRLLRQAGAGGADIVLVPASEWREIDPIQTYVAIVRAVESGVSLVKATRGASSVVVDPAGRVLAWGPWRGADSELLQAAVPTRGARTLYSQLGDLFGLFCLALLAFLLWHTL